jgi:hypothetical protein
MVNNMKIDVREISCEDGRRVELSGSCPVSELGLHRVQACGSATRVLINKKGHKLFILW